MTSKNHKLETAPALGTPLFPALPQLPASLLRYYPGPLAGLLVLLVMLASAHLSFNLGDEGDLWYGAQRVLAGEVPLRDFQGYDPGRYYWAAGVMALLHSHGIVALQVSAALFGAIGIGLATWLVFRGQERPSFWFVLMAAVSFIVWIGLRHKIFEITVSVISVAVLAWLIEAPTRRRSFITGMAVGIAAIFGRNHGLYAAVADTAAFAIIAFAEKRATFLPNYLCWMGGMVLGYLPMLLAAAFVPGFFQGAWVEITTIIATGSTNANLPVPWPWLVTHAGPGAAEVARYVLTGTLLIALPVFGLAGAGYAVWRALKGKGPVAPLLLASFLLAMPYTHHAFARASLGHLSQAIYPMLIGVFALVLSLPRIQALIAAAVVCGLSLFLLLPTEPLYQRWTSPKPWVEMQVGADRLSLAPWDAGRIGLVMALVGKYAPGGQTFMAEPYMPGAYALFDQGAPVWDAFAVLPSDTQVQQAELERVKTAHPAFVLIEGYGQDGNPALSYRNTYPSVYDYVVQHYRRIEDASVPARWDWELYVPADAGDARRPGGVEEADD